MFNIACDRIPVVNSFDQQRALLKQREEAELTVAKALERDL